MREWCLAHPWMTFIVCLFAIDSVKLSISWRRKSKDEK